MYLLLFTQGVMNEIGTKYDELCLHKTSEVGDIIQTDLRLKKGVDAWTNLHNVELRGTFDFNTALSVCRSAAQRSAMNKMYHTEEDLYGAGLEGVAKAFVKEGIDRSGLWSYSIRSAKNAIVDHIRKANRWTNEVPDVNTQTFIANSASANQYTGGSSNVADDLTLIPNSLEALWQMAGRDPEEALLRKEEKEVAYEKVVPILWTLNDRERYVLFNHIVAEEPATVREMAKEHGVSKSSIQRDINRVRRRLRI